MTGLNCFRFKCQGTNAIIARIMSHSMPLISPRRHFRPEKKIFFSVSDLEISVNKHCSSAAMREAVVPPISKHSHTVPTTFLRLRVLFLQLPEKGLTSPILVLVHMYGSNLLNIFGFTVSHNSFHVFRECINFSKFST